MALSTPSNGSTLVPTTSPDMPEHHPDSVLKSDLWNIFKPPSVLSEPSRSSLIPSSPSRSNPSELRSSIIKNASQLSRKPARRARFENDPHHPCRCRRCGREIAPGTKRTTSLTASHHTPECIAEIGEELPAPAPPPQEPLPPPPPLIPLAGPVVSESREKTAPVLPHGPGQQRRLASRAISDARPTPTVTSNSELVERTKGIMASLSPNLAPTPSVRSRTSETRLAATNSTFPRTGRMNSLSQFMSQPRPTRRTKTHPSVGKPVSVPIDELGRRTREPPPPTVSNSPLYNLPVLNISPEMTTTAESDTSGPDDSPVQGAVEPLILELPISDSASVFCMSGYLQSVFEHMSPNEASDCLQDGETQDDTNSQDILVPQTKSRQGGEQDVNEQDIDQGPDSPIEWSGSSARDSGEVNGQRVSSVEFSAEGSDEKEDGIYKGKRYRSWNVRARNSRRPNKPSMEWTPPESWTAPPERPERPEPQSSSPDDTQQPQVDEHSANATCTSLDEALKPLTYLVHHRKTSSIDVCSTSDQPRTFGGSEGCLASSEGTLDSDESSIRAGQQQSSRVRRLAWQDTGVLEVLPKLKELKLGKSRK